MSKVKAWMTDLAKDSGRNQLHPFTMGIIKSIVNDGGYTAEEIVEEIKGALVALEQTWMDDSLPWDSRDVKKAPLPESLEEIDLYNFTTLDSVAEEILRREA